MRKHICVCLIALAALLAAATIIVSNGCATGRSVDGHTVVGFPVGAEAPDGWEAGVSTAGAAIGGIFGGPGGALAGGAIASALAGVVGLVLGKKEGRATAAPAIAKARDDGWDERDAHQRVIDNAYDAGHSDGRSTAGPAVVVGPVVPRVQVSSADTGGGFRQD